MAPRSTHSVLSSSLPSVRQIFWHAPPSPQATVGWFSRAAGSTHSASEFAGCLTGGSALLWAIFLHMSTHRYPDLRGGLCSLSAAVTSYTLSPQT